MLVMPRSSSVSTIVPRKNLIQPVDADAVNLHLVFRGNTVVYADSVKADKAGVDGRKICLRAVCGDGENAVS